MNVKGRTEDLVREINQIYEEHESIIRRQLEQLAEVGDE